MKVTYCKDCKYSSYDKEEIAMRCNNPVVNSNDPWALAYRTFKGASCYEERRKRGFFTNCGIKGKLWEQKSELDNTSQT